MFIQEQAKSQIRAFAPIEMLELVQLGFWIGDFGFKNAEY